ncbi:MAG TPA: M61 family peptidase [Rhodanobacteraceae bacterium]|nr:M61 family peptidase [Rhodanobacteraceae bacterium]
MKMSLHLSAALLAASLCLATPTARAGTDLPPVADTPWPGTITIHVDATDLAHRIFKVHETVPVTPGPMILLYPAWIPGHHSLSNPINKVAGLVITANGQRLDWVRDKYHVYAFHIDVPQGVDSLDVAFDFLSPQSRREGAVVMTPEMLNLSWNKVSLYPAGHNASLITFKPSVTLPEGWQFGTALEVASRDGNTTHFKPIDYANLVDSPMYAGKYFKRVDLTPAGGAPVHMDIVADAPQYLEITPEQLKVHRNIVTQILKLYGAHHYDHYDFLVSLSDEMSGKGLEHHRSSEDGMRTGYFTEWKHNWVGRDLLTHEFNHSWDGKYRRPADLATPNFNVPMGDSLLWVYEGQTQYYGNVLDVRAGLLDKDQGLQILAMVAATYDRNRPGMSWRTIQDTTNDPSIGHRSPLPYRNYQMSEDYYSGGQMIWLAVDAKIRSLTGNKRSLDTFAHAFYGMHNGAWDVNTYTFDDVVATLNQVAPHDWAHFLRSRLDGHGNLSDAIADAGWKLVYTDEKSDALKQYEKQRHVVNATYSLGFSASSKGDLRDVRWDGPAFKAGLAPGMSIVAVNNREFSGDLLEAAIRDAAGKNGKPVELLVKDQGHYKTITIDYHGGLQYPHLVRDKSKPDYLSDILAPR